MPGYDIANEEAGADLLAAQRHWESKWPNHCRKCGGHGGRIYWESHGLPGPREQCMDYCEALPITKCHRCGEDGLTEDGEGPCTKCGWDFNDGMPEP